MNGNAQIVKAVKLDKGGIGYVSAGYVMKGYRQTDEGFKILRIAANGQPAYSPLDKKAVESQQYCLLRPLFQYVRRESLDKQNRSSNLSKALRGKKFYWQTVISR